MSFKTFCRCVLEALPWCQLAGSAAVLTFLAFHVGARG
jgi:hypothetical protein